MFKTTYKTKLVLLSFVLAITISIFVNSEFIFNKSVKNQKTISSFDFPESKTERKKARSEYFLKMLRDPATNLIPPNIRQREIEFSKNLPKRSYGLFKENEVTFTWKEAGPNDVGGRTRALAVDITNSQTIIAGGVSGGIWKSTDNGENWKLKSDHGDQLSVTYVAQDPQNTRNWYYSSGEYYGNSATDRGARAYFQGSGIYKSTDSGETWTQIQSAGKENVFDTPYDYVSKIVISPTTGSIFISCNGLGIYKSTNGGETFSPVLVGNPNDFYYFSEVAVSNDGKLVATLSGNINKEPAIPPGIHKSEDDGEVWINITPATYKDFFISRRGVVEFSTSNSETFYVWTQGFLNNFESITKLHKINFTNGISEDRSNNLPNFGGLAGDLNTQGGYNMILAVKPDDENFVLLGGTNLYRSRDGFATPANQLTENWIGGYHNTANDFSWYPNQHPDQHAIFFDPEDPNKMWSGHDGGLSFIEDITSTAETLPWINKNNGYNVTQFYTVEIHNNANDDRLLGGTQDNGTPYFVFEDPLTTPSVDASTGDGSYCYLGDNFAYTSAQLGVIIRLNYDANKNPIEDGYFIVHPINVSGQLFIHPFVVDPNDEEVMYYPAGKELWRNNSLSSINNVDLDGTSQGWTKLDSVESDTSLPIQITALGVSTNPAHILYIGLSGNNLPKVYKFNNSSTADSSFVDVSPKISTSNTYLHHIAVNPEDADEILLVFSNYNITGLYHSINGGQTYTAVEGNLEGDENNPGPSLRCASILTYNDEKKYLVATSTGAYSASELNGSNTIWEQEGSEIIGNVVSAFITSRNSDGLVAIGTHGRGIFVGKPGKIVNVDKNKQEIPAKFVLEQNYPNPFNPVTKIKYTIRTPPQPSPYRGEGIREGLVTLKIYDILGSEITTLVNEKKAPGEYEVEFNGSGLSSGVYIYKLEAGEFVKTKKMLLLR